MSGALLHALLLWLAAHAAVVALWPARRLATVPRTAVLALGAALLLYVPWLQPRRPLGPFLLVAASSLILVLKLGDLHVGAAWWRARRLGAWLRYVPMPFVLVLRRHEEEPRRPRRTNVRLLVRGAAEVALGLALLGVAGRVDLAAHAWWLDHTVRLVAVYLIAFDGGMVTLCALLRLANVHVMEFSRHPIVARTPADFWRRYNRPGGRWLHENVYKPAGGLRRPLRGTLLAFLVNGLLHEYMAWLLVGRIQGYQLAFFVLHAAAVTATFRLRPRGTYAVASGVATFLFLAATSVLFFATLENIEPGWLYPRGGLLP